MSGRSYPVPADYAQAVIARVEAIPPAKRSHDEALLLMGARFSLKAREKNADYKARVGYDATTQVAAWREANPERNKATQDRTAMPRQIKTVEARIERMRAEGKSLSRIAPWYAKLAGYRERLRVAQAVLDA